MILGDLIARGRRWWRHAGTTDLDDGAVAERRRMFAHVMGSSAAVWSSSGAAAGRQAEPTSTSIGATARIDVRAFGARGDRTTDDLGAIRQAIAAATKTDQYPRSVFVPAGNYRRSDTIAVPNHLCLFGEGVSSVLNSQNDHGFDRAILTNAANSGLISARFQDLTLYGGSHGLKLQASEENADLRLQNVGMLLQSVANVEANKLLQTTKITNCVFGSAPYGIKVIGTGTNCLTAVGSEWLDHSEGAIFLRGADGVTIVGGRFEGGGRKGRFCIDIENASNVLFVGCFFENVHEYLARLRAISGAVVFQSCHFSGTSLDGGPLQAFRWDIADSRVVFRDCLSVQPMGVGGQIALEGVNHGIFSTDILLKGSVQSGCLIAQPRELAGDPLDLVTIVAPPGGGDWQVIGSLTVVDHRGAAPARSSPIPIAVSAASVNVPLARAAGELRLIRRDATRWSIARMGGDAARFGWIFRWESMGTAAPSAIVPALTR